MMHRKFLLNGFNKLILVQANNAGTQKRNLHGSCHISTAKAEGINCKTSD